MATEIPWRGLGLSRIAVRVGDDTVTVADGHVREGDSSAEDPSRPLIVCPIDASERVPKDAIDLREFARVLHPTLMEHHLGALRVHYGLTDAGAPSSAAVAVLGAMMREMLGLDRELIALLARLLSSPLSELFERALPLSGEAPRGPSPVQPPAPGVGVPEGATAEEVLGSDGRIAAVLPAYERRAGQLEMARVVGEAFRDGEALLVEAGPGTGKTFAYLVPAILHLRNERSSRVIVSTRTKQLQEQLHRKDVPFLVRSLAPNIRTALLKGRENYLCLRRWQALVMEQLYGGLERERLAMLAPLARWRAESVSGDIDENAAYLGQPGARKLWSRLCDTPSHCIGAFCPFHAECFSVAARRRARKADLVIVNHSLLLGDLAVNGVVLGRYTDLIIDEAHSLESVGRTVLTRTLSERIVARIAEDLAPGGRRSGWLRRLPFPPEDDDVRRLREDVRALRRRVATWFHRLDRALPEGQRGGFSTLADVAPRIGELGSALERIGTALERLADRLEVEELRAEAEGYLDRITQLGELARSLAAVPDDNTVHWYERGTDGPSLHATPLDVAPTFRERLFPRIESAVLTSATLATGGDFEYVATSLGLTDGVLPVRTTVVDSPFSFEDRMKVVVPSGFPPVSGDSEPYADRVASLLATLMARLGRKGLALFTSYRMLGAVRERLASTVVTYAQGFDGSRSSLLERFRSDPRPALLLGTESFWEGVDLPGEAMELLAITRLPFAVPTDPVLSALADRLAREGRDPFRDLAVPQAVLKLRQGVGRLIRTREDRGVVVVTDRRIVTRGYGSRFARSLPVPVESFDEEDRLVETVARWFGPAGDGGQEGSPGMGIDVPRSSG